jgi:hypothetical protein
VVNSKPLGDLVVPDALFLYHLRYINAAFCPSLDDFAIDRLEDIQGIYVLV